MSSSIDNDISLSSIKKDAELYNSVVSTAFDINHGFVRNGIFTATRSVRDIDANTRRSFLYQTILDSPTTLPPTEITSDVKYRKASPSGDKIAVLKTTTQKETTQHVIEIWTNGGTILEQRHPLPKSLSVCMDWILFGSMAWNGAEDALVFVGSTDVSTTFKSFFDKPTEEKDRTDTVDINKIGKQFTLDIEGGIRPEWGEKYNSQNSNFELYILSLATGKIKEIKNVPSKLRHTLGQVIFSPSGKQVIYTAWECASPRRLGITYCQQRPCKIYSSTVSSLLEQLHDENGSDESCDEEMTCLTPNFMLSFSPRVASNQKKLIYLSNEKGFHTHLGCMALHSMDFGDDGAKLDTHKVLVQHVQTPDSSFPGLFTTDLPSECFSGDEKYVFLNTVWNSMSKVVQVDIQDGTLTPLDFDLMSDITTASVDDSSPFAHDCSQNFMCSAGDKGIIVTQSQPNHPPVVALLTLDSSSSPQTLLKPTPIAISSFSPICPIPTFPLSFTWKYVTDPVPSILLLPQSSSSPPPLIVVPHGGPHVSLLTQYLPTYAYLVQSGYALLLVNYHGSLGYGQDFVESLPGNIGTLDVGDVVKATQSVLDVVDPSRVGICGGSHGGFLGAHCIGQHPDLFKVAVLRNPVTDLVTMIGTTDIPDWCYIECFPDIPPPPLPTPPYYTKDDLGMMYEKSPIAHLSKVKAPTLIALGVDDKRVSMKNQGLEYYYLLKEKGVECKLLMYEGQAHPLDGPVTESDHWVNIKQWFDKHL